MKLVRNRIVKRLGILLALGLCAGASVAQTQSGAAVLRQIQEAARQLNYVGVYAYQQGDFIESSRITHQFDGKQERERVEVLDGAPREYLRVDDEVQCLIPEQKTILRERQRGDRFRIAAYRSKVNREQLQRIGRRSPAPSCGSSMPAY